MTLMMWTLFWNRYVIISFGLGEHFSKLKPEEKLSGCGDKVPESVAGNYSASAKTSTALRKIQNSSPMISFSSNHRGRNRRTIYKTPACMLDSKEMI